MQLYTKAMKGTSKFCWLVWHTKERIKPPVPATGRAEEDVLDLEDGADDGDGNEGTDSVVGVGNGGEGGVGADAATDGDGNRDELAPNDM